jgi:hypothetical protein
MGILRALFGPSKAEVWQQLSQQIGGQFSKADRLHGDRVQVHASGWTVLLDSFFEDDGDGGTTDYTRLRAPYVNPEAFRFSVTRKGIFSGLGKLFHAQDIEIGEPKFDEAFVIKGTDENRVKALFADPEVRRLLEALPNVSLHVIDSDGAYRPKFPDNVDELVFVVPGIVKNIDQLKTMFDMFAAILHRLTQIGGAYEGDPGVAL